MVVMDGYSIQEYPNERKIVICLPRKSKTLGDVLLGVILSLVKYGYESLSD